MANGSELRLIKGITTPLYLAIRPYTTALPSDTAINIQSADAPVIAMLNPTMKLETANAIIQERIKAKFVTVTQFLSFPLVQQYPILEKKITDTSKYFMVRTSVTIENQQNVIYTLLERAAKDKSAIVTIVWQSRGIPA